MINKKEKKKVGRPRTPIDKEQVERLASLQCTLEEMAYFFGVDKSTISRNFATEIAKGRAIGRISIRRNQFNLSKTNATMLIWLGKQYLGQRDEIINLDEFPIIEVKIVDSK